ncbi:hypothetical protein BH23BAC1_BH23BAC1_05090 [soil metagenome]
MKTSFVDLTDNPEEKTETFLVPGKIEDFSPFLDLKEDEIDLHPETKWDNEERLWQGENLSEGNTEMENENEEWESSEGEDYRLDEFTDEFNFEHNLNSLEDSGDNLNYHSHEIIKNSDEFAELTEENNFLDIVPEDQESLEMSELTMELELEENFNRVDEEEYATYEFSPTISPAEPIKLPIQNPVEFARLPLPNSYWPVVTSHPNGKEVPYQRQDNKFVGNSSRRFLASRLNNTRYHAGIDLYANHRDPVVACEDGKIKNFYHFYEGTYALIIEHDDLVINYGEVASDSLKINQLKVGDSVKAGQRIAVIGKMKTSSMLHFETYRKGTTANERFIINGSKPKNLLNPTKYLLRLRSTGSEVKFSDTISTQQNNSDNLGWSKVIKLNDNYAQKLGWNKFYNQINDLLLKATNQSGISLGEEAFAEAVAKWQSQQGFSGKDSDGIIGPKTWQVMKPLVTKSSGSLTSEIAPEKFFSSEVKVLSASFQGIKGLKVNSTKRLDKDQIHNESDIIIACVSEVEGGFDTVNMYDRGIISWGIMQWTAHAGSLQKFMAYIKPKFLQNLGLSNWQKAFGGLDINNNNHFTFKGEEYPVTKNNLPLIKLFRNSNDTNLIHYNSETAKYWATVFALAGRHNFLRKMQMEYTALEIEKAVKYNLGKFLLKVKQIPKYTEYISLKPDQLPQFERPVNAYVGNNLKTRMLYFGMWTNNPTWSIIKLFHAVESFMIRKKISNGNSQQWPSGWEKEFADEYENTLRKTTVGYWGDEKAKKNKRESRTCKLMKRFISITENRTLKCP